ncbi:MAG: STAS domain-containing protein [Acidobacteriota bacterium]
MKVEVTERNPGVFVVAVQGEVDMSSSPGVRNALLPIFKKGAARIVVDLSGVPYMDSSGIATLVEGLQLSRKSNVRFTLAGVCPSVEAVFELAYLKSVFEIVPSLDAAFEGGKSA